jgi:ParB family chromosome partitioning protein
MRAQGLLQPVVVRYSGTEHRERYELVAGERRLRAAKLLGWEFVPALCKRMDDAAAAALAAIENLQRASSRRSRRPRRSRG